MEACDELIYSSPLDIVFIVDTVCGLSVTQCRKQQYYVSSLVELVKNRINKVAYIECNRDPQRIIRLKDDRINDIPGNEPDSDELTQLFNTIRNSQTCEDNWFNNNFSQHPDKLQCLDVAINEFDLNDFSRFKKIVYISNCQEDENLDDDDSICSRNDLQDIGGRIDLIPINIATLEFNIDANELECIVPDRKRIFDYDYIDDLNNNRQFEDIQHEICEPPTAVPTPSPSPGPTKEPSPAPTDNPTDAPTDGPTPSPSPSPTNNPTRGPTDSPSPAPTHSPGYEAKCVYTEPTDVIFVVDESCDISNDDIKHQNEFIANMVQRIKYQSLDPRLGYIGCQPNIQTILHLDNPLYNNNIQDINQEDIRRMSLIFRDNNGYNPNGGKPPREECIKQAINSFDPNKRNNKIVLISNCQESGQSDICSLKDNEILNYPQHIDFIFVNIGTDPADINTCLDNSNDRLFYYSRFDQLNANSGQAQALCDEICESPTPQPTNHPSS